MGETILTKEENMIIEEQITIEASEVSESWRVYSKYLKEPWSSNFKGIFSNVDARAMFKQEFHWSEEKITRVIEQGNYEDGEYEAVLKLAQKIQIAELSQNNEFQRALSTPRRTRLFSETS